MKYYLKLVCLPVLDMGLKHTITEEEYNKLPDNIKVYYYYY